MKKKHNYLERVEYLKKDYFKYLTSKNDKGLKSIKNELIKIIHKWENRINRLDDENEKIFQEQLKNEAMMFLDKVKNSIKQMEENMEEPIDATNEINLVKETCSNYASEVEKLLRICENYFVSANFENTEKLINQLETNFNKWKNVIDTFPSIDLSGEYNILYNKFTEIKNEFKRATTQTEENIDNENDANDTDETETEEKDNNDTSEEENDSSNDDNKSTNNTNEHAKTVDAEVVEEKDDSVNWSCAAGSTILGVALGVIAAFFFTGDD